MIASIFLNFYRLWHGTLHLKGAGWLLRQALPFVRGLNTYQLQLDEGQAVIVDFRDVSATYWLNHLLGDRFEEEGLLSALKNEMHRESVVWDVGSNCGLFSYRLAKECESRQVVFFEPNPAMFDLSKQALAPFDKVVGHQLALSSSSGVARFTVTAASTNGTIEAERTNRSGRIIEVQCVTGDELTSNSQAPVPDIVKIDTEGHELSVIRGLDKTIKKHKPIIFFEHISLTDKEICSIVPSDYDLFTVNDLDGSLSTKFDRSRGHNSVLMPKIQNANKALDSTAYRR
jgi:FkbM family methyltransferase